MANSSESINSKGSHGHSPSDRYGEPPSEEELQKSIAHDKEQAELFRRHCRARNLDPEALLQKWTEEARDFDFDDLAEQSILDILDDLERTKTEK